MSLRAGLDIGSRTVKFAVISENTVVFSKILPASHDPVSLCSSMIAEVEFDSLVATGYGRHLAKEYLGAPVVSEIKAFAAGVRFYYPDSRTVLDIGGQDTKAISLHENGSLNRFEMNDKCAAGTGRFLEIMAAALGYTMEDFIDAAYDSTDTHDINTTCTVFAESEIVSLVNRGVPRDVLARGIHRAAAQRAAGLIARVGLKDDFVFAGGVAFNKCVCRYMGELLNAKVHVPENPQLTGAVGAALSALV